MRDEWSIYMSRALHTERMRHLRSLLSRRGVRVHFAGIYGASMSSLSMILSRRGCRVSGSDCRADEEKIVGADIPVSGANSPELMTDAELLIYSFAIPENSPERSYARLFGIPEYSRAELLGALMWDYTVRAGISGTHGKSTTTAMLHAIISSAGMEPTTLSGAELATGTRYEIGKNDIMIYEACEYRDAFHKFSPTHAILLGIELDHTDYFKSMAQLEDSYVTALTDATEVLVNADCPVASRVGKRIPGRVFTVGMTPLADYRYIPGDEGFHFYAPGEVSGFIPMRVPGKHNMANGAMAAAMADRLGVNFDAIALALSRFAGIPRRLELLAKKRGKKIYYDYAHHPTEIAASINTLRLLCGSVCVIFSPHTYTRTKDLWDGFVRALSLCDRVLICDVFAAREAAIEGVNAVALARDIGDKASYVSHSEAAEIAMKSDTGAIVLMGAGDVTDIKKEFLEIEDD